MGSHDKKRRSKRAFVILGGAAVIAVGIAFLKVSNRGDQNQREAPEPASLERTWKDEDIIFRYAEEEVTYGELKEFWCSANDLTAEAFDATGEQDKVKAFLQYSNDLLMAAEARARGLDRTEAYQAKLLQWEMNTLPNVYWFEEIVAKVNPTDEELLQYIPLALPDVRVRVLVKETMEEARRVHDLVAGGATMEELCGTESIGLSGKKGCLTPYMNERQNSMFPVPLVRRFLEAEEGELLEPFFQDIGFLVVEIDDHRTAEELREAELERARVALLDRLRNEEMDRRLEEWREQVDVTIHAEGIAEYTQSRNPDATVVEIDGRAFSAGYVFELMGMGPHGKDSFGGRVEEFVEEYLVNQKAKEIGLDEKAEYLAKRTAAEMSMMAQLLKEDIVREVAESSLTEEEFRDYYESNLEHEFRKGEQRRVRLIQFLSEEVARRGWSRLEAGEDFAEMAEEVSLDHISGPKGGDIGYWEEDRLRPELAQVVFSLEPKSHSRPFAVDFGTGPVWLVVMVDDVREPSVEPFESVKTPKYAARIKTQKRTKALGSLVEDLRAKYGHEFCF